MIAYYILAALLTVTAALLIRAEFRFDKKQIYVFKPISSAILVITVLLSFFRDGQHVTGYTVSLCAGMLFCMGGDMALMFMDNKKAFRIGLALFLIGHLVYTAVFTVFSGFSGFDIVSGAVLCAAAAAIFIFLYPGLGDMKVPVLVYILVISLMMNRAVSTNWGSFFFRAQALCITLGAFLFYVSDVILAVNRFRMPMKYNRISLAFYYSGQMLIMVSAGLF